MTTTTVTGVATRVHFGAAVRRYSTVTRTSDCGDYIIKTMRAVDGSYYVIYYRGARLGTEQTMMDARDAVNLHAESIRPA